MPPLITSRPFKRTKRSLSDFPFLSNFNLSGFTNVYYVDAINGSDGNSGTDINDPFQTWPHTLNVSTTNAAIVVLPGEYDALTGGESGRVGSQPAFQAKHRQRIMAAQPGTAIFANNVGTSRDSPMFRRHIGGDPVSADRAFLYGLVFKHFFAATSINYRKSIFRFCHYNLYNCAYFIGNPSHQWNPSMNYDNNANRIPRLYNCTFSLYRTGQQGTWSTSYSGNVVQAYDSVFINTINNAYISANGTTAAYSNSGYDLSNVDFNFTDNRDVTNGAGVYTGTYAWPQPPSTY